MGKAIYKSLRKTAIFLKENPAYVIWFLFYFTFAYLTLVLESKRISNITAFFICLVFYSLSLFIALKFGEPILKYIYGVRPIETKEEKEYLLPLFEAVKEDVMKKYPDTPNVDLYIIDKLSANACAIGKHTIAVTKGAINIFSEEELQGIILHEFAHIYYNNTTAEILNKIGNGFFSVYIIVANLFFKILDLLFTDLDDPDTKHTSVLFRALFAFMRFSINLSIHILLLIGNVILSGNSRKSELRADSFAYKIGYGENLKNALYLIQKMSFGADMKLIEKIQQNHPRISMRIARLEALQEQEQAQYDEI